MQEADKKTLIYLQNMLIDNVNVDVIIPHLLESNILTRDGVEAIRSKATPKDRCLTLLNLLPGRGPNAFRGFVESLRRTNQSDLATMLMDEEVVPLDTRGSRQQDTSGPRRLVPETRYVSRPLRTASQYHRFLHYKPSSAVQSPPSILGLRIEIKSKEEVVGAAMSRNPAVQTLPTLEDVDLESLERNVAFVLNHTLLADGLLTVVSGRASNDAGMLFAADGSPISLNIHLTQPIVRCHHLSGRPKIFLLLLYVDERIRDLASFYRTLGHDCFVVIYRRRNDNYPFSQVIVRALANIVDKLGRAPITGQNMMAPLLDISSPDLDVVNSLR